MLLSPQFVVGSTKKKRCRAAESRPLAVIDLANWVVPSRDMFGKEEDQLEHEGMRACRRVAESDGR